MNKKSFFLFQLLLIPSFAFANKDFHHPIQNQSAPALGNAEQLFKNVMNLLDQGYHFRPQENPDGSQVVKDLKEMFLANLPVIQKKLPSLSIISTTQLSPEMQDDWQNSSQKLIQSQMAQDILQSYKKKLTEQLRLVSETMNQIKTSGRDFFSNLFSSGDKKKLPALEAQKNQIQSKINHTEEVLSLLSPAIENYRNNLDRIYKNTLHAPTQNTKPNTLTNNTPAHESYFSLNEEDTNPQWGALTQDSSDTANTLNAQEDLFQSQEMLLDPRLRALNQKNKDLDQRNQDLIREIEKLKETSSQNQDFSKDFSSQASLKKDTTLENELFTRKLQKDLAQLMEQNDLLKQQVKDQDDTIQTLDQLREKKDQNFDSKNKEFQRTITNLTEQLKASQTLQEEIMQKSAHAEKEASTMGAQNIQLQQELSFLQEELSFLQKAHKEHLAEIQTLQKKQLKSQQEKMRLNQEKESFQEEHQRAQEENASWQQIAARLQAEVAEKDFKTQGISQELEKAQNDNTQLREKNQTLQNEKDELQITVDEIQNIAKKWITQLNDQLSEEKENNRILQEKISSLTK